MIFHFNTYMPVFVYVFLESLSTLFILKKRSIGYITHMAKNNLEQSYGLYYKQTWNPDTQRLVKSVSMVLEKIFFKVFGTITTYMYLFSFPAYIL